MRGFEYLLINVYEVFPEIVDQRISSRQFRRRFLYVLGDFLEVGFMPIESLVDLRVQVPSHDAAAGYEQGAVERDPGVQGAELEIAVVQDKYRANNPADHMETKPGFRRAHESQPPVSFPERIEK